MRRVADAGFRAALGTGFQLQHAGLVTLDVNGQLHVHAVLVDLDLAEEGVLLDLAGGQIRAAQGDRLVAGGKAELVAVQIVAVGNVPMDDDPVTPGGGRDAVGLVRLEEFLLGGQPGAEAEEQQEGDQSVHRLSPTQFR